MTIVKTWVDDRGGTIKKLTPALYRAIIDEAHKRNVRVAVHATQLEDAKDLLRAGVDVFAHMISDVDDELVDAVQAASEHRRADRARRTAARRFTRRGSIRRTRSSTETVSPAQIKRLQDRLASVRRPRSSSARARPGRAWPAASRD